jgi:HD-GYP domain-containing protein (c-di-GMP phosphodiesterase class II)
MFGTKTGASVAAAKPDSPPSILETRLKRAGGGVTFDPAALGMAPLSLHVLVPGHPVPADLFLARYDPRKGRTEMVPAAKKGEEFQARWRDNLINAGQEKVYVPVQEREALNEYFSRTSREILDDSQTTRRKRALFLQEMASFNIQLLFGPELSAKALSEVAQNTRRHVDLAIRDSQVLTRISDVLRRDYSSYTHAVNVSMLAMSYGRFMNLPEGQIRSLGMGGLLLDVGMARLSASIREKAGALSRDEMAAVRTHPILGYDLLKPIGAVPFDVLMIVRHHHENADGSGYPDGQTAKRTPPGAKIIRVIDAYDAMTSDRPYRSAMSPFEAGSQVKAGTPHHFSPEIASSFLRFLASPFFVAEGA